jgi:hypothetical protein
MKLFAVLLGALALLAGVAGGMHAYSASATTAPAAPSVTVSHHAAAQVVRPGVVVKWAPCRAPAVRQGRACVTHVTHTVSVPAPAVTVPAAPLPASAPQVAPTRATQPAAAPQHESGDHEPGDDGGEHESGDDGGEHHDGGEDD